MQDSLSRKRTRRSRGWLAIALLLAWVPACGAILGIDDGVLEDSGAGHDAGGSVGGDAARDGAHPRDSGKGDADAFTAPPPTDGGTIVYVSADGSASTPCGTRKEPCLTVHDGITTAAALVTSERSVTVWVGEGEYAESVVLASGVSLRGGFTPDWAIAQGDGGTVITGVGAATLTAKNLTSQISVSALTLKSTASPDPGQSVYGVFATSDADAGAPLTLEDVKVQLGPGGAGAAGTKGAAGPVAPATCATSGNPFVGSGGADAPDDGTFSIDGFTPSAGGTGSPGGTGLSGNTGTAECATGCIKGCNIIGVCDGTGESNVCAAPGPAGCGGGGGAGGTGGQGGGSSVALFVWNVPVIVKGGALGAGNGGNGGKGGPGGNGGPGGPGAAPATATCVSACVNNPTCSLTSASATSQHGTPGGQGGIGGGGGDGAGGSSYSLYAGGSSSPIISGVVGYSQGQAGAGNPPGVAAQQGSSSE